MDRISSSARPPRPSALTLGLFLVGALGSTVPAVAQGTLEARIREGVFVVFDGDGQSLVVLGDAPASAGPLRALRPATPQSDWVIAARALARRHPAVLDGLEGQAVRIVGAERACEATLGAPVVVRLLSRNVIEFNRDLEQASGELTEAQALRYVWNTARRGFVVAPLVGSCPGGVVATTRVDAPTTIYSRAAEGEAADAPFLRAFPRTARAQELRAILRELPSDWPVPSTTVQRWALGTTHQLALVERVLEESCSSTPFVTLFDGRSDPPREVPSRYSGLEAVLDLDGDGTLELVFRFANWSRVVVRLPPGARSLVPIASVELPQSTGC